MPLRGHHPGALGRRGDVHHEHLRGLEERVLPRQRVGDLPAVAVLQLKTSPDGGTLYAATHGRGIYTIRTGTLR